jgi:hypothetical protein
VGRVQEGIVTLPTPCRFGDGPAVAVFDLDRGCACFPDDHRQALCVQHAIRSTPLGSMRLAQDLTAGGAFSAWWEGRR